MQYSDIDENDRKLIAKAEEILERNYDDPRYTVGAAVLCDSGKIYAGVNIESCGYGPCAEPIAIGAAISNGETRILSIVAVGKPRKPHSILPPCGNCRQLLFDYYPDCLVILTHNDGIVKVNVRELLPHAYGNFD